MHLFSTRSLTKALASGSMIRWRHSRHARQDWFQSCCGSALLPRAVGSPTSKSTIWNSRLQERSGMGLSPHLDRGGCNFSRQIRFFLPRLLVRCALLLLSLGLISCLAIVARADTVGSISATVTDQTGGVIPDTTVTARNLDTTVQRTTKTNANGFYNFTALPVGRYEIEILREGFNPYKRTGLVVDVNSQLRADVGLSMGEQKEEVVV